MVNFKETADRYESGVKKMLLVASVVWHTTLCIHFCSKVLVSAVVQSYRQDSLRSVFDVKLTKNKKSIWTYALPRYETISTFQLYLCFRMLNLGFWIDKVEYVSSKKVHVIKIFFCCRSKHVTMVITFWQILLNLTVVQLEDIQATQKIM